MRLSFEPPTFQAKNYGAKKVVSIKTLEKFIQDQILDWLKLQINTFVWRQNAGSMFVDGPTGRHGFRAASVQGISDIIGIWNGYPIAIEVKQPKKKPTELQRGFLKEFANNGGIALCVHSLEELQRNLMEAENDDDLAYPSRLKHFYKENE